MAYKERLVDGNILYTYDVVLTLVDNLVDHRKRVAVGKELTNAVDVHNRGNRGIVKGSLEILTLDILANLLGKGGVE